jgi:multidrug efflux pump subunit AcrA (membrane-fusion protein)
MSSSSNSARLLNRQANQEKIVETSATMQATLRSAELNRQSFRYFRSFQQGQAFEAARSKVAADSATIAAAQAEIQRLQTQLNDRDLKAPVRARVLYKVAEPGEDQ